MKEASRCTGPDEHAHVDPLGGLGEQVTEGDGGRPTFHREVGIHRPAGDVNG
jgi:hypothetical protein